MAQERKRGCGYRKIGAMYLCGDYMPVPCERLPYLLETCPVCGAGIKVSRGFTKVNPLQLFGYHQPCSDQLRPCWMCDPAEDPAFIMGVGQKYYKSPVEFIKEGLDLGISKRIPFIPKELELGKTVVYLAHPKACAVRESIALQQAMALVHGDSAETGRLIETETVEYRMGIFTVFVPQRVEKLVWQSEAIPEELQKLKRKGITPVIIKDGDPDHA